MAVAKSPRSQRGRCPGRAHFSGRASRRPANLRSTTRPIRRSACQFRYLIPFSIRRRRAHLGRAGRRGIQPASAQERRGIARQLEPANRRPHPRFILRRRRFNGAGTRDEGKGKAKAPEQPRVRTGRSHRHTRARHVAAARPRPTRLYCSSRAIRCASGGCVGNASLLSPSVL